MEADEANRVRQGASPTTSPDVLWELAQDPSVTVRASLAMNPALPPSVAALLSDDTDARVRNILNRKLARLTPDLKTEARRRMQQDAVANLTAMGADAAIKVRASIASAVSELPDGPREIVLHLAHDPAVMVSGPVIQFSPMLTQEDLIALIASSPPPTTILAVANRPRIGTAVSDAIVDTNDLSAITALLANRTAQIREATLDALAAQSEQHTSWQEPLVNRPHLSPKAQRMLSEIVTGHLLETLAARPDLDPKVGLSLRQALERRRPVSPLRPDMNDLDARSALNRAEGLHEAGKLDDYAILDAMRRNAMISATAMFAVKAGVPVSVIERACRLRSAKAIVSLAWRAKMSAQTGVVLQAMLACIPPDEVLRPVQGHGHPLSDEEMRWQLSFLGVVEDGNAATTPQATA